MSASQRLHIDYGFIPKGLRPRFYMKGGVWRVEVKRGVGLKKLDAINNDATLFCIYLNEQLNNEQEKETE